MTDVKKSNGVATAGMVVAIIALVYNIIASFTISSLGWWLIPAFIIWIVGIVLSIIGVCHKPRIRAIAGLAISGIFWGFLWLLVLGEMFSAMTSYFYP